MNRKTVSWISVAVLGLLVYGLGLLLGQRVERTVHHHVIGTQSADSRVALKSASADTESLGADPGDAAAEQPSAFLAGGRTAWDLFEVKVRESQHSGDRWAYDWQLGPLLYGLSTDDHLKAWKLVRGLPRRKAGDIPESATWEALLEGDLVNAWARKDPHAAMKAVLAVADDEARNRLLQSVLATWARKEPGAALARVREMPAGKPHDDALQAIIHGVAEEDPAGAIHLLDELPAGRTRAGAVASVISAIAPNDPDRATGLLDGVDPLDRLYAMVAIANSKASRSVADTVAWAETLNNPTDQKTALDCVLGRLIESDPQQAVKLVTSRTDAKLRTQLANSLASSWAGRDPPAAAAWIAQLPEGALRQQAWEGLKTQLMVDDPEAVAEFALTLFPSGSARSDALRSVAKLWTRSGPDDEAMQWANQLPAGTERDAFYSGACDNLAFAQPEEAARLAGLMSPGEEQNDVVQKIARFWAFFGDTEQALAWGTKLPDGPARDAAFVQIAGAWAAKDPASAAEWLRSLPADDTRAKAAEQFVVQTAGKRPDLAAQWVGSIADDQTRRAQTESISREWKKKDPKAAQAWLDALAAAERQQ